MTEEINAEYEETSGKHSLSAEERETIIQWADGENRDKIFIYSSYQPMVRRLLKNPHFECQCKAYNKSYSCHPNPVSVEGTLPRKCLTIRKSLSKRKYSDQERKDMAERFNRALGRSGTPNAQGNSDLKES